MDQSLSEHRLTEPRRIVLPILVLYNMSLSHSTTYQTFVASSHLGDLDQAFIAVYDNSPTPQVNQDEEAHLLAYKHNPANNGLATAYNWALDIAELHEISWLLLLDQDSTLPCEFLESSLLQVWQHHRNEGVAAIVPVIRSGGLVVSPMRVGVGRLKSLPEFSFGIQSEEIMAINSGAAIRCDFVRSIGGFNRAYWLDYLDHWLFHQIFSSGRKVMISNCILDHKLSVQDYRHEVSTERYRSILNGEAAFITTHKSHFEKFLYLLRLFCRCLKLLLVVRNVRMAAITMTMFGRIAMNPMRSLEVVPR
jgi:GT2 family glycosyltransferase